MWLLTVLPSSRKEKKLTATFCPCETKNCCKGRDYKKVHFGQEGSTTFVSGATEQQKQAYLKRHAPTENWSSPTTPGALSRWILWNKSTLSASIADFKKRFSL